MVDRRGGIVGDERGAVGGEVGVGAFLGFPPFGFDLFEFLSDRGSLGAHRRVVETALSVGPLDLLVGDVTQDRAVVQDRVEVGLVDVGVAASVGVAQRRQCLVDGGGGLGAALVEDRWLRAAGIVDRGRGVLPYRGGGGLAGGVAQPLVGAATVSARAGAAPTALDYCATHAAGPRRPVMGQWMTGLSVSGPASSAMAASSASQPASESRPLPLPATSIAAATSARVSRLSVNT